MPDTLLQQIVRPYPEKDVGVALDREDEAVVKRHAPLPAVLEAFQLFGMKRRMAGILQQAFQCFVDPLAQLLGQGVVVRGKARGGTERHALVRIRRFNAPFIASTESNVPATRPARRSASAARSPFCHSSVHQYR